MNKQQTMRKAFFQIEDDQIFEGFTDGSKWNGFANPYFDYQTAKTVLAYYQNQPCEEYREQWENWDLTPSKTINGKDYYFFGGGYIWYELEPMNFLTDLLEKFCTIQNLPLICADELLNSRDYDRHVNNSYVKGWLESFCEFWNFEQDWNDTTNDRS